jgi:hypothetical protein
VIELSKIRIDGGTQPRAELNQETVDEYRRRNQDGRELPPVTLFYDGSHYWLADGFHRYFGAKAAGRTTIHEDITPGTLREAILYSLSANSKHGLRRSNADKRRAVQTLLDDAEWGAWSRQRAGASVRSFGVVRWRRAEGSLFRNYSDRPTARTVTTKHGTTTTMNTANVGKKAKPAEPEKPAEPPPPPEPEYTPLDAAHDQISDLQDALARASVGELSAEEKEEAAGLIARLREEVRVLKATLKAVTASRDHYQAENGELKHQIRLQRREIDKLAGTKTA